MRGVFSLLVISAGMFGLGVPEAVCEQDCLQASRLVRQGADLGDGSAQEEKLYRDAIALCPGMAESHHNLGLVLSRRGVREEAAAEFGKAIEIKDDPSFSIALANLQVEQNDIAGAKKNYLKSLDAEGKNVKALQGLSVICDREKQYAQAIEYLKKAQGIEPGNAITNFNLAVMYERSGDLALAIPAYQKVIEVDNDHFDAIFYAGLALMKSGRSEDAAANLVRAATLRPDSAEVHRALGILYEEAGDLDKAELALKKAVSLNAADMSSRINLGVILIKKQQPEQAVQSLRQAVQVDAQNPRALSVLGWAELELGEYRQAQQSLERSIELDAMNALAHNNLGVVYQRAGKVDDARREFETALRLSPELEVARKNLDRLG